MISIINSQSCTKQWTYLLLLFIAFLDQRLPLLIPSSLIPISSQSSNLQSFAGDEHRTLSDEEDVGADLTSRRIDTSLDGTRKSVRAEHDVRRQRDCHTSSKHAFKVSLYVPFSL